MVLDQLSNGSNYAGLNQRIEQAFQYLQNTDFDALELGKYELDGDHLFAILMEYDTKPANECKLEAHRKYIDVQYIVSGEELVDYVLFDNQEVTVPYSEEKDVLFFNGKTSTFVFQKGQFSVFFPQDLHRPGIQVNGSAKLKKVVIKMKI